MMNRIFIEVLKFLDPFDVLLEVQLVSKAYQEFALSEELWHFYCQEMETDTKIVSNSWLSTFRFQCVSKCYRCSEELKDTSSAHFCRILRRILCGNCKELPSQSLILWDDIHHLFNIQPEALNLKYHFSNGIRTSHYIMVKEGINQFRNKNKSLLLEKLKDLGNCAEDVRRLVEGLDVKEFLKYPDSHVEDTQFINYFCDKNNPRMVSALIFVKYAHPDIDSALQKILTVIN